MISHSLFLILRALILFFSRYPSLLQTPSAFWPYPTRWGPLLRPEWPGLQRHPTKQASPPALLPPLVGVPEAVQSPGFLLSTLMSKCVQITSTQLSGLLSICYRFSHYPAKETWLILTFPFPGWFLTVGLLGVEVLSKWHFVASFRFAPSLCFPPLRCSLHWRCSLKPFACFLFQVLATQVLVFCQLTSLPHFPLSYSCAL